jgi:hypothetical protein
MDVYLNDQQMLVVVHNQNKLIHLKMMKAVVLAY